MSRLGDRLRAIALQWKRKRPEPYTETGIRRLKCIRCGDPARFQWQICSDGNNYRPLCLHCDVDLNALVLDFMRHPDAEQLSADYLAAKQREAGHG